jgi:hypothetical protein
MPAIIKKLLEYQGISGFCYGDLSRVRTCDPHPVKMVLSQLSYEIMSVSETIDIIPTDRSEVNRVSAFFEIRV